MYSAVSPAANIAKTCSTAMRMSRMIGLPPNTSERTVIRRKSSLSGVKAYTSAQLRAAIRSLQRL